MTVAGVDEPYVDCTSLLVALLLRAAKDTLAERERAMEAQQWLEQDGVALAAILGVDLRRWLRESPQRRISRQRIAALS